MPSPFTCCDIDRAVRRLHNLQVGACGRAWLAAAVPGGPEVCSRVVGTVRGARKAAILRLPGSIRCQACMAQVLQCSRILHWRRAGSYILDRAALPPCLRMVLFDRIVCDLCLGPDRPILARNSLSVTPYLGPAVPIGQGYIGYEPILLVGETLEQLAEQTQLALILRHKVSAAACERAHW